MDLVARYLDAVKTFLPQPQKDDIAAELSESILSRMEAREAQLGRPLTEAEQGAILKAFGNPALVAGQYRTEPQRLAFGRELIGPALFPLYARILALTTIPAFASAVIASLAVGRTVWETLPAIVLHLLVQFSIVTASFTAAQAYLTRYPERWNPRDPLSPPPMAIDPQWSARADALVQLAILGAILLWLRATPLNFEAETAAFALAPVWGQLYQPVVALLLAGLVPPLLTLFWPHRARLRAAARVAVEGGWLALFLVLLRAGEWVILTAPTDNARRLVDGINQSFWYGLIAIAIVSALQLLWDARPLLRRAPRHF